MEKDRLKFSADGTSACIIFADGEESAFYESKQELLGSLPGLIGLGRITQDEALEIAKATFAADENFPNELDEDDVLHSFLEFFPGIPLPGFGIGIGIPMMPDFKSILFEGIFPDVGPNAIINEPTFRVCECGGHGMILFKNSPKHRLNTDVILSKKQARKLIDAYEKDYGKLPEEQKKNCYRKLIIQNFRNREKMLTSRSRETKNRSYA